MGGCREQTAAAAEALERVGQAATPTPDVVAAAQRADAELSRIISYLETGELPVGATEVTRLGVMAAKRGGYYVSGGRLYVGARGRSQLPEVDRLVIPRALVNHVLEGAHDEPMGGGHSGFDRTYAKVRQRYYWDGMYADTREWVLRCPTCLSRKLTQRRDVPIRGFGREEMPHPFYYVSVDVVGPLPVTDSGNKYIVVFTDYLTRWVEAFAVPNYNAETVAGLLVREIMPRHGAPKVLLADNGQPFRSKFIEEVAKLLGVQQRHSSPYHPQCNGLTERMNGTLVGLLSLIADAGQRDWDLRLPFVLLTHRSAVNRTFGCSPFQLMYGREAVLPFEAMLQKERRELPARWASVAEYRDKLVEDLELSHQMVRQFLEDQQDMREDAAAAPRLNAQRFKPGDLVWLYHFIREKGLSPKLSAKRWFGPYVIERRLENSDTYEVVPASPNQEGPKLNIPFVHAIRLRKYDVRAADAPRDMEAPRLVPAEPALVSREGPNKGRVFRKGETIELSSTYWRANAVRTTVRRGDAVPVVIVHVDRAARQLHVVSSRNWEDKEAFADSLGRYLQLYKGKQLDRWKEWYSRTRRVGVDGDDILPIAAACLVVSLDVGAILPISPALLLSNLALLV